MSIECMDLVHRRAEPANTAQRLILLTLADQADQDGVCQASMRRLAERTRLTEREVQKCLHSLVKAGLLLVKAGGFNEATGRQGSNISILLPLLPEGRAEPARARRHR